MKLKKYITERKRFKGLEFDGISSVDKDNYKSIVFRTEDGKKVYPAILSAGLPLNVFTAITKLLKRELGSK